MVKRSKFYKVSNTVFLGGSLINRGGQNPIEAARLGSSIIHGPNVDNFKEVYRLFRDKKISHSVKNFYKLKKSIDKLIRTNKKNNKYLKIKKIGNQILLKTTDEINKLLTNEIKKT